MGQSNVIANNNLQLIIYYEVPVGQLDEVKQKFGNNYRRNLVTLQQRN
jgi:hypothetical protein